MKILTFLLLKNAFAQNPQMTVNTGGLDAILQASIVVQMTLLALVGLSVLCWAIGWTKWQQLKNLKAANEIFSNRFWKSSSLDDLYEDVDSFHHSSLARVFKASYLEMKKLADSQKNKNPEDARPQLAGIDNIERILRKSIDNEIAAMESRLTVLATTGSTGPFIGLFGTVWGIMTSFHKIGQMGSASLAVVAPGISEALIATAIGLAAAIPAVMLYNNFNSQIKKQENELNNFSTDFLNIVKRNFFVER